MNINENASQYIPHEAPMVFVDDLIEIFDQGALARLNIRPELLFCTAQGLPSWTSIELMAQTISAYSGRNGHQQGLTPRIGFLLGTRKLNLPVAFFELGSTLTIRIEQQYLHEGLGQFACEIEYQTHKISALLSVYEPTVDQHNKEHT
ncbi:hotdog family protein [uncultured Acinetobacter sp.]|uniref:hotdog family protein n=1 Tax=uncultured Acinetobacter sp. TaxID=165433 RepID=UPI00258665F7|nr:hotdog family protein [uncultured Acinetobacter sp.]